MGRHAADKFSTAIPTDCPVDSRVAVQPPAEYYPNAPSIIPTDAAYIAKSSLFISFFSAQQPA